MRNRIIVILLGLAVIGALGVAGNAAARNIEAGSWVDRGSEFPAYVPTLAALAH